MSEDTVVYGFQAMLVPDKKRWENFLSNENSLMVTSLHANIHIFINFLSLLYSCYCHTFISLVHRTVECSVFRDDLLCLSSESVWGFPLGTFGRWLHRPHFSIFRIKTSNLELSVSNCLHWKCCENMRILTCLHTFVKYLWILWCVWSALVWSFMLTASFSMNRMLDI